ncbi:sterol methyltransferase [Aspergillus stella-maris]|uniref:sterol methyltransferase n=1 Tax=Aspergillus stella-maris TaxID=1810926 RepID=UPI003CCDB29B
MAIAQQEQDEQVAALVQQLHGTSGESQGLFAMRKDFKAHKIVLDGYFKYFGKTIDDEKDPCAEERRLKEYSTMVRLFYNLVTDFYEYGWCQSFHFCRFGHAEPFMQAIARHEHYLAHQIGIREGMSVLDVGCGLGGPAREIARLTDAHIIGLNNNEYQINKARRYVAQWGLQDQISFVKGDFAQMALTFETPGEGEGEGEGIFDAAYAIEATMHAPTLESVYSGIYRVLKPGAIFGVYEWLLTGNFDYADAGHRRLALDIQQGNGIAKLFTVEQGLAAMVAAGFEIMHHEDLALRPADVPWWYPLSVSLWSARRFSDLIAYAPMSKLGRSVTHYLTGSLEALRVLPKGTRAVATSLSVAADALVEAGELNIFTPMYLMVGRKPAERG